MLGGGLIAAIVVMMALLSLSENSVYFLTPLEAATKAPSLQGKDVKVGGMVVVGSVEWQPEQLSLAFTLTDMTETLIRVSHHGTPPDMFKEGSGVVVEGRLSPDGKAMVGHTLMVKHSEEYKIPESGQSMDKALIEKSMFK
jgi:cytochrome c-type biogenesis protein CcmE